MDRETRKANLKKLQLPATSGNKQRKTRQTSKSAAATNTAISKYFLTPEKQNINIKELTNNNMVTDHLPRSPEENASSATRPRAKRAKLDAFLFKDPSNIPSTIKRVKQTSNDEDLIVPERKIKKAPKSSQQTKSKTSKSSKARKQTVIKTAFLRNEQLFAEIAAQHCAADQFDVDDVQLALAISKSEAENDGAKIKADYIENSENDVGNIVDEVDSIREKLRTYGFRTAEKKDYNTFAAAFLPKNNNRRLKSKWANKFTALTLRNSEIQLKKLQQNIERLLNNQFRTKPLIEKDQMLPVYELQSFMLKQSAVQHEDKWILRNAVDANQPKESFFVTDLFEINPLSAGHLLKDWHAIQGRDLTPNAKDKQNIEQIKTLENIYQDLEEYFDARKRLDWTTPTDFKDDHSKTLSKELSQNKESTVKQETPAASSFQVVEVVENEELDGMIELIENIQRNEKECGANEMSEPNSTTNSTYDKKIFQLLPSSKTLDAMQVSSCSINTQATINSTQKNRSNSPDLFADSDVELEEINKTKDRVTNLEENVDRDVSADDLKTDITTYEIFTSDEVKKTSLLELHNCHNKESLQKRSIECKNGDITDLTQEAVQSINTTTNGLTQSKLIIEDDLFAESPPPEENSDAVDIDSKSQHIECTQTDKEEHFKFTLSLATDNKEQLISDEKTEKSFRVSPKVEKFRKQLEKDQNYKVAEIVMDRTDQSLLNFEDIKQLENSFYKTPATIETDVIEYNLSGNDSLFRELCNKYLKREAANDSSVREQETKDLYRPSLQNTKPIKTPPQSESFANVSQDFDVADDNDLTGHAKSPSLAAKSPSKPVLADPKINLSKYQSFCQLKSDISIDLTQNDSEDETPAMEEDDDCLVLSDDEINYSIWQANKTLQNQKHNTTSLPSNISSSDEDCKTFNKENIIEFPFTKENEKEFSYLDLEEKEKSLIKITLGPEETISDFDELTSKYAPSNVIGQEERQIDRSEFGILEEYSEPVDFTPNLCTPTKALTEASFLSSPTERTAPMKCYSRCRKSSEKFKDFLIDVQAKSPPPRDIPDFEDFDDFNLLLTASPLNSANAPKQPQGLDQLLNAEISFMENQKTPPTSKKSPSETQIVKCNNRTYSVRYTNSPKPDYTTYSEAELLKELYNYGIKPLKRKQAVKMLEYIYNQTHPILMEDAEDAVLVDKYPEDVLTLDDFELPCTSKEALKSIKSMPQSNDMNLTIYLDDSDSEMAVNRLEITNKTLGLQDCYGLEILRYSHDLKAELQDEIYILQTNVTKKTPQPLLPLHIAWYNLVCSNIKLHETILMYEPIDLQEIYLFLKSIGYRYDPKDLKTFFDRRCIIFRYDLAGAAAGVGGNNKLKNSNRHVRKCKKSKSAMM